MQRASASALALGLAGHAGGSYNPATDLSPEIPVSLGQAHKGTPAIDLDLLDSYGKPPEGVRQFFIAARDLFENNQFATFGNHAELSDAARQFGLAHYGGPMLGQVSSECVSVWLRTLKPAKVSVKVVSENGEAKSFGPVQSTIPSDLAAIVRLDGLRPDTEYCYSVWVDGRELTLNDSLRFTTLPPPGRETCRIAFGSCFHKVGIHNPHLLSQVKSRGNRAMLLLGDLAVDDRNNRVGLHRSDYLLRDLSLAWREFAACVPLYAAWDDHDYFDNDLAGIPNGYTAKDALAVREIWTRNWNNPAYGEDGEGIYFHTRIGPADLIMLDTRSLRKNRKRVENAYLGDKQTAWLKRELLKCEGPFVIITSGTMWSDNISNGKDSWGVWDPKGREDLFQFIEDKHVPGVLFLSGDRHGARGIQVRRPSGHTFYEFEPATLGGMTGPPAWGEDKDSQLFGRTKLRAFGEFTFDTKPSDPTVTFRLVDESGAALEEVVLRRSELTG